MIRAGIIGATGYAGQILFNILLNHPEIEVSFISSRSYGGEPYRHIYKNYFKISDIICNDDNINLKDIDIDVLFIALPHGIASGLITKDIINKYKVIDLGADFRLKNVKAYEDWYKVKHLNHSLVNEATYGLCELNRDKIKQSSLISNPGCYTTCSILSLAPLVKEGIIDNSSILIDAKSGVTGAGRGINLDTHYTECNESTKAYKIASHRHTPEIEEQLNNYSENDFNILFTPHLIPMNRGILTTSYAKLSKKVSYQDIKDIYEEFYENEQFIRLLPEDIFPETKWVKGSNYMDINFKIDKRTNNIIVIGALDNLIKGASGQAIQNMNILFDFEENCGINMTPNFPI